MSQRRRKKHKTKQHLAHIKAQWPLFGQLCADSKSLTDIPYYWPMMNQLKLPRFQYMVREVVSGLSFTGYGDELTKTYAILMAQKVCAHLKTHRIDMQKLTWQTDNGKEYSHCSQTSIPASYSSKR